MATPVQEQADIFRLVIHDPVSSWWTDDDVLKFYVNAERRFTSLAPDDALSELQAQHTLTMAAAAGTERFGRATWADLETALSRSISRIRTVETLKATGAKFAPARLTGLTEFLAIVKSPGLGGKGLDDSPVWTTFKREILYYPVTLNGSIRTSMILNPVLAYPPTGALTDTFEVNDAHVDCLTDWALHLGFARFDQERAAYHRDNFYGYLQMIGAKWAGVHAAAQEGDVLRAPND